MIILWCPRPRLAGVRSRQGHSNEKSVGDREFRPEKTGVRSRQGPFIAGFTVYDNYDL